MLWLSQFQTFTSEIDDPLILSGDKEGQVNIDFSKLTESDALGESQYIVGGRLYYEADVIGYRISSFTGKGFFD